MKANLGDARLVEVIYKDHYIFHRVGKEEVNVAGPMFNRVVGYLLSEDDQVLRVVSGICGAFQEDNDPMAVADDLQGTVILKAEVVEIRDLTRMNARPVNR